MVGDRENDILAAREAGLDSIGILWGYGSREELTEAGATCLAETPVDVERLVNKGTKQYIFEEIKNDYTRYADPNRKENLQEQNHHGTDSQVYGG